MLTKSPQPEPQQARTSSSLSSNTPSGVLALGCRIPEILAPVGGKEQFLAALNAGADAVFLGLKAFNARSRADNFSIEDLASLVPLAHRYGMKVLVTFNVLIKDNELSKVIETLGELQDIGVDALIVQDLGVAKLVKTYFPTFRLHASTQLAIHNLAGVIQAASWGFKRVVVARELTALEISRMTSALRDQCSDVELEVFCHGSLCYSYSGLCFFSGAADGRSGNRGECAYTCREPYKVVSEAGQGFLFSMRDLDLSHKLDALAKSGVHTLKIEGRKKDAQYVASVVRLYRKKLDDAFGLSTLRNSAPPSLTQLSSEEAEIREDLGYSFQRRKTSFFLEGRYHENVIDLDTPTHMGLFLGKITAHKDDLVTVALERDLERFDGVRLTPDKEVYHAKPQHGDLVQGNPESLTSAMNKRFENSELAFSVRDILVKGRWTPRVDRNQIVDITIPQDVLSSVQGSLVGFRIYKTRSVKVKQQTEALLKLPAGEKLRPEVAVELRMTLESFDDLSLRVVVDVMRWGQKIAEGEARLQTASVRRTGSLKDDVTDVLKVFGDIGISSHAIHIETTKEWFVPKGFLKDLKRALEPKILDGIKNQSQSNSKNALQYVESVERFMPLAPTLSAGMSVKVDRLESLDALSSIKETLFAASDELAFDEVVFEPKKMFLDTIKPEVILERLVRFVRDTNLKVRIALPTVIRAWDEPLLKVWLQCFNEAGFEDFEVGGPGAQRLLTDWGVKVRSLTTDFTYYGLNRVACDFLAREESSCEHVTLSIEDDKVDIESLLSHWPTNVKAMPQMILFKDTPLFIGEACSLTALHNGCPTSKVCGYRDLEIENSKGERFIVAHEGCKSIVYGKKAYSISGERRNMMAHGVDRFRVDFLTRHYSVEAMSAVLRDVIVDKKIVETHDANLNSFLK
jgi:putative protease